MTPTAGSLFTGVGGLDLAVNEVFGSETLWMCEYDRHARSVLERQFSDIPVLHDVHEVDDDTPRVDILHGGYPCQPFSFAGKRLGDDDPRHLWDEFARCVRVLRPRVVVLENVAGHVAFGFPAVAGDLSALGYDARWGSVRASEAGAPHRRQRLFCVAWETGVVAAADPERERQHGRQERTGAGRGTGSSWARGAATDDGPDTEWEEGEQLTLEQTVEGTTKPGRSETAWGPYEPAIRQWELVLGRAAPPPTNAETRLMPEFVEWMMGFPAGWTEGHTRSQRLKMLGNAVCPQQGALALRVLTA